LAHGGRCSHYGKHVLKWLKHFSFFLLRMYMFVTFTCLEAFCEEKTYVVL
jgi:hypothetical protein